MELLVRRVNANSESGGATGTDSAVRLPVREHRLRQVVDIIDSEPACSIRELALRVSLSPAHLQRLFKQETGTQLGGLVVERRLQKAAHLLTISNLSIKEIAHVVGYRHHSSFVRAFQRRFALAPKHYRRQPDDSA
jgi:transcriptional regulator GlxA family with amidase domain